MESSERPVVRVFKGIGYLTALLTLIFGLSRAWEAVSDHFAKKAQVNSLIAASEVQRSGSDYRGAWTTLEKAAAIEPGGEVSRRQEDLAMEWLRNIRVPEGQTFTSIVTLLSPVLTGGVTRNSGSRKADILAHLGWGDYLRYRENDQQLRPESYFEQAFKEDAGNVFAHTFAAYWILWRRGPVNEAAEHFKAALDSGRERPFVREYQFAALFNNGRLDEATELLRVASDMVKNSESISGIVQEGIFNRTYWSSRQDPSLRQAYISALGAEDHLNMFEALYGRQAAPSLYRNDEAIRDFWLATLLDRAGHPQEALEQYLAARNVYDTDPSKNERYREDFMRETDEAIRRLQAAAGAH